jgi:hypothetical protein
MLTFNIISRRNYYEIVLFIVVNDLYSFVFFFNYYNLIKNIQDIPYNSNLNIYEKNINKKQKHLIYYTSINSL